ncbi:MAG TPA: PAS domain S-box protein [Pyrinomonadaceae bacterium]|nr:PAS domain S-box protein [Pyrinomonadaceae bacterium]
MTGRQLQGAAEPPPQWRARGWRAYAVAPLAVALATLLTFPLHKLLGAEAGRIPFALYFGAAFLAAWWGGRWPGLAAVALSAAAANFFFFPPIFAFALDFASLVQVAVFVSVASLIVYVADRGQRDRDAAHQSREALGRRERELTDFVENATVGLHWVGADGTILWANRAELEMLGYDEGEYVGHNIAEFHVDREAIDDILCRLSSGEALDNYEARLRRKDGAVRHVLINSNVMWGEQGEFVHTRCFTRDITERVEAERALRDSATELSRLAAIVESSQDAIISKTLDGVITSWNAGAERMYGYTAGEALGRHISMLAPPERAGEIEDILRRLGAGEHVEHLETQRVRKDGVRLDVSLAVSPVKDASGRVVGASTIARDITERRRSEQSARFLAGVSELLSSSLDYEATLERLARLSVSSLAADHCVVDLLGDDGRARRVVSTHVDPSMQEVMNGLRNHPPREGGEFGVPRVLRTGRPEIVSATSEETLRAMARDPEHLALLRRLGLHSFMTVPLFARGRIIGALTLGTTEGGREYDERDLVFAEEVARRAALAIDNARLYREARESNRLKDEFLATLSHELRTPLTPVIGWTHMIRTGRLTEAEVRQGLEVIDKNSQALALLINDLLDMSSILSGKMSIERAPVRLDEVVSAAVETVRPHAEARRVSLDLSLDGLDRGARAPLVSGDRTRLGQVFWNLLTNAVKFSPPGARVSVRASAVDGHARVEVADEGRGIAPDFLPYVFERFRQADQTTTRSHGGLGIGLALVKSFVEAHGGTARAESDGLGLGSRFTVTLPLVPAQSAEAAPRKDDGEAGLQPTARAPQPDAGERRVLLVEDAPDTLEMLKVVLAALGYRVVGCGTADEALRAARDVWFDIVVSDIGLPQVDGYELLRRLRRELPHTRRSPAIALTGYASAKDAEAALAAGYDVHIPKPVDPTALAEAVERLLREKPRPEV